MDHEFESEPTDHSHWMSLSGQPAVRLIAGTHALMRPSEDPLPEVERSRFFGQGDPVFGGVQFLGAVFVLNLLEYPGLVAPMSIWTQGAVALGSVAMVRWMGQSSAPSDSSRALHTRIALQSMAATLIIYITGWGSALVMAYLGVFLQNFRTSGIRAILPCLLWTLAGIAVGQAGLAFGILPSLIDVHFSHLLAATSTLGLGVIVHLLRQVISDRERTREQAMHTESRFRSLVQHSSDLIMVIDPERVIRFHTPSSVRLLGREYRSLIGTQISELLDVEDSQRVEVLLRDAPGEGTATQPIEVKMRHRDGRWVPVELVCTNLLADKAVRGLVLNGRDITERNALQSQLVHQAFHDPLTGLANRSMFRYRLGQVAIRCNREGQIASVILIDLDEFKTINDSLGHFVGDQLLLEVVRRLETLPGSRDCFARLGGDEFAMYLEGADERASFQMAERVMMRLREPFTIEEKKLTLTASIGIALSAAQGVDAEALVRNADLAMHQAKERGRGCTTVFRPPMHKQMLKRLSLKEDLRRAIDRREFVLHYQPTLDLNTNRLVSFEALIRWNHPKRGLAGPLEFICVAEEAGLIGEIGHWVLLEACRQLRRWQLQFPDAAQLSVGVNLSTRQFQEPDLVDKVARVLALSDLKPSSLVLEVTESAAMREVQATIHQVNQLKALGVRFAIDDFGTGYSSLSYLQQFPFDILKVDKSFVDNVVDGEEQAGLTHTIIAMARTLRMTTVAEGIERPEQVDALKKMGCHLGQGFLFSKPLTVDQAELLLGEREIPTVVGTPVQVGAPAAL